MTVWGCDISRYQGDVSWSRVKAAGISFATIKASEGTPTETYASTRDYFRREFRELRASGMVPGAYHVIRSVDTAAQIDWFLDQIVAAGGDPAECILQLDYEKWTYDFPSYAKLKSCVAELKRRVPGAKPIMYTGKWVWDQVTGEPANAAADLGCTLWDSNYGTNPAVNYRTAYPGDSSYRWRGYGGWPVASVLQYGSRTSIDGVSGYCDANAYRGTLAEFRALLLASDGGTVPDVGVDIGEKVPLAKWVVEAFQDDPGVADGSLNLETTLAAGYAYPRLRSEVLSEVLASLTSLTDAHERHAAESAQRDGLIIELLGEVRSGNRIAEDVVAEIGRLLTA